MKIKITWQLLVLVAILLAAVIVSELVNGGDDKTIIMIVTVVLSSTLGPAAVAARTSEKIDQVQQSADRAVAQTNGQLDQRIRDGVRAVLDEREAETPAGAHAAPVTQPLPPSPL